MKTTPQIAETVVCRGAPEYRFEVDGNEFPWHLDPTGPRFTRLQTELYRVDLTILGCLRGKPEYHEPYFSDGEYDITIAGQPFPWRITEQGITYHRSQTTLATVKLSFLTKTVDTDMTIYDARRGGYLTADVTAVIGGEMVI